MGSNMEGNWQLQNSLCFEKPIPTRSCTTYKPTFPFDSDTGQVLVKDPASVDEELLHQNIEKYSSIKLLRGLWKEGGGSSSGTFFPVAAPANGVMWCGAGHCLISQRQRDWRCGNGWHVLPTSPSSTLAVRDVVDLSWLTAGRPSSELAEFTFSQPPQLMNLLVEPDFGFMLTLQPVMQPRQLFIPCARQLMKGDPVCVLGFAERPHVEWACRALRNKIDVEQDINDYRTRHKSEPPANWDPPLPEHVALARLMELQEEVLFPSRLVAAPGQVNAASQRIIEHTCSTFPGMSGGPGVDIATPWQLLFVHMRADFSPQRGNYGYSVNHPLFVKAYEREVLPKLLTTPSQLLTLEMVRCLHEYLEANRDELADLGMLDKVAQLLSA